LLVPPDEGLALAPWFAVGVGGGAVVQDPPVGGPGPAPLVRDPVLLPAGFAPRRLVDPAGVDAAIDPAAAGGGAIVVQLLVGRDRVAVAVPSVDLGEHRLSYRLFRYSERRVVPRQVQQWLVHLVNRPGELLAKLPAEVVGEPQFAARVAGRLDRLVV